MSTFSGEDHHEIINASPTKTQYPFTTIDIVPNQAHIRLKTELSSNSGKIQEMVEVITDIAIFLFRLVFEIICAWTGEIVLFLFSIGKHKPRWDLYAKDSSSRFVIFSEMSLWIGMAFWLAVIAVSYKLLN